MKFRTLTLLPLFLLAVVSCTFRRSNPQLTEIERRLDSFPEEMWERLGEPELQQSLGSRAERMHYALLRAEAMNKTTRNMDSLRFDTINAYFQRYGDANLRMRSLYIMGSICRDEGNAPLAIQYYREAVSHADTAAADCDILTLSRIYGQMALLYEQQMLPRKALESWRAAARYADRTTDTLSSIQYRQLRSRSFEQLHELDSASYYDVQALESFTKLGIRSYIASSQSFLILPCIEEGNYPKAKQLIDEYIADSGLFDGNGRVNPYCTEFLSYLGIYYCAIGNPDSAIYYYRQRLSYTHDVTNLAMGYKGLLDAYEMKHEPDSMAKYARLYAAAKDSSNKVHAADEVIRMEATYNYAEHQRIAAEKTRETARLWRMLIFVLVVSLLGMEAAWKYYRLVRKQRQKMEEDRRRAMEEYDNLCERLQTAEEELHASKHNQQAFIADKEAEIARLRALLDESRRAQQRNEKGEAELLNSTIVRQLRRKATETSAITEEDWHELHEAIREFTPEFCNLTVVLHQFLTKQEILLVVLTRCYFSLYEIRMLMNLSAQRFTNIRANINRKLFGEQGAKTLTTNIMDMPKSLKV